MNGWMNGWNTMPNLEKEKTLLETLFFDFIQIIINKGVFFHPQYFFHVLGSYKIQGKLFSPTNSPHRAEKKPRFVQFQKGKLFPPDSPTHPRFFAPNLTQQKREKRKKTHIKNVSVENHRVQVRVRALAQGEMDPMPTRRLPGPCSTQR